MSATGRPGETYSIMDDRVLVNAVRRGDEAALAEFVFRFQRVVLGQARRHRIPCHRRREWVLDLLHDVAMALRRPRSRPPDSIVAYLVQVCHHKWVDDLREAERAAGRASVAAPDSCTADETELSGGCSQFTLESSRGVDREDAPVSPVLRTLAGVLTHGVSEDDRRIISWLSQDASHAEIARMLGITRSGATHRVRRLCARLLEAAREHARVLEFKEREELLRFLRRADVYDDAELAELERSL